MKDRQTYKAANCQQWLFNHQTNQQDEARDGVVHEVHLVVASGEPAGEKNGARGWVRVPGHTRGECNPESRAAQRLLRGSTTRALFLCSG